jgi:hypothetical protein
MRGSENEIVRLFWQCGSYYSPGSNTERFHITKSRILQDDRVFDRTYPLINRYISSIQFLVAERWDEEEL